MTNYLTVAEVAELAKLSERTIRDWIAKGKLPAVRPGGVRRVRIAEHEFERVMRGAEPESSGEIAV